MKRFAKELLFFLAFCVGIALIAGVTSKIVINLSDNNNEDKVSKRVVKEYFQEEEMYDSFDVKELFMDGCMEEAPGEYAYCSCAYNYIIDNVGKDGFIELSIEMVSGEAMSDESTEFLADAVMYCIDDLDY